MKESLKFILATHNHLATNLILNYLIQFIFFYQNSQYLSNKYALKSGLYSGNKDRFLKFWYHMYSDVGSLTIYRSFTDSQLLV